MELAGLIVDALAALGTLGAVVVALYLARASQREARRTEQRRALLQLIDGLTRQQHEHRRAGGTLTVLVPGGPAMHELQLPLLSLPRSMAAVVRLAVGEELGAAEMAKVDRYLTELTRRAFVSGPDNRRMTPEIRGHALRELRDDLAGLV